MLYTLYGFFSDLKFIFDRQIFYNSILHLKLLVLRNILNLKTLPQRKRTSLLSHLNLNRALLILWIPANPFWKDK